MNTKSYELGYKAANKLINATSKTTSAVQNGALVTKSFFTGFAAAFKETKNQAPTFSPQDEHPLFTDEHQKSAEEVRDAANEVLRNADVDRSAWIYDEQTEPVIVNAETQPGAC